MAGAYKTQGVYIVENGAFPNSVVEVATAVPAFVGYTEKADNKGVSLRNKPWRITSLAEFHTYFGYAPLTQFSLDTTAAGQVSDFVQGKDGFSLTQTSPNYRLYHSMVLFFQNGGGTCYIVSVGAFDAGIDKEMISAGIDALLKEQEPTLVVVPDAVALPFAECINVQQAMLGHCGQTKNRFAILDIPDGFKARSDPAGDCVEAFRNALGMNFLEFSAAYYPWLVTSVIQTSGVGFGNIQNRDVLKSVLLSELATLVCDQKQIDAMTSVINKIPAPGTFIASDVAADLHKNLFSVSPFYQAMVHKLCDKQNLLPPSGAMAGVYTMVDNSRGVWKAPANVSLSAVVAPAVQLAHDDQEDLNVCASGKSINAIRTFIGEGTLVWGARTLDGNSLDWRYINVRRTMIMLEESIKLATKAYVFEPNASNTWITIKSMLRSFLTGIWKRGGLAGSVPDDAFDVCVGLGETMTGEDILEGILRVTVLVAIVRPAEFIEITFQQQMQKS